MHYCYLTTNLINGKKYFGSHSWSGKGLDPRYKGSGTVLKKAINKYGWENFSCVIIKEFDNELDCRNFEEEVLLMFGLREDEGFYNVKNNAIGAGYGEDNPFYGKKHSEKTREKISKAHIGMHKGEKHPMYGKSGSKSPRGKKVYCVELDKVFGSVREAERETGICHTGICSCCKGKLKTTGGYQWRYVNE